MRYCDACFAAASCWSSEAAVACCLFCGGVRGLSHVDTFAHNKSGIALPGLEPAAKDFCLVLCIVQEHELWLQPSSMDAKAGFCGATSSRAGLNVKVPKPDVVLSTYEVVCSGSYVRQTILVQFNRLAAYVHT
jgi:hypothetical protein